MTHITYDSSRDVLLASLLDNVGREFLADGTVLRDSSGRLSFFTTQSSPEGNERNRIRGLVLDAIGPYAKEQRLIVYADDEDYSGIRESKDRFPIEYDGIPLNYLDKRVVGEGWLEIPTLEISDPPRIVFATLKGGVGRSTALVVAAADLARRNKNVLIVDFDLEAPGLGYMLLTDDAMPDYGVVDFLVEGGVGNSAEFIAKAVGTSKLTDPQGGRVDVMPALGKISLQSPENIISKLSRALVDKVDESGRVSLSMQLQSAISQACDLANYDVVLIDSRAGLAELAAPAVLNMGATVLIFGTAQKQTFEGYRALFAALQILAVRDLAYGRSAEWRGSIRTVYAKSSMDTDTAKKFLQDFYELYTVHLYDSEVASVDGTEKPSADAFIFAEGQKEAPHYPLTIGFSQSFIDFDPANKPAQLTQDFYEASFRSFLNGIDKIISGTSKVGNE